MVTWQAPIRLWKTLTKATQLLLDGFAHSSWNSWICLRLTDDAVSYRDRLKVLRMRAGLDNSAANADSKVGFVVVFSQYQLFNVSEMSSFSMGGALDTRSALSCGWGFPPPPPHLKNVTLNVNWNPKLVWPKNQSHLCRYFGVRSWILDLLCSFEYVKFVLKSSAILAPTTKLKKVYSYTDVPICLLFSSDFLAAVHRSFFCNFGGVRFGWSESGGVGYNSSIQTDGGFLKLFLEFRLRFSRGRWTRSRVGNWRTNSINGRQSAILHQHCKYFGYCCSIVTVFNWRRQ